MDLAFCLVPYFPVPPSHPIPGTFISLSPLLFLATPLLSLLLIPPPFPSLPTHLEYF